VGFLTLLSLSILQFSNYSQDPKSPTFLERFTSTGEARSQAAELNPTGMVTMLSGESLTLRI
jgi:hypothetical protein